MKLGDMDVAELGETAVIDKQPTNANTILVGYLIAQELQPLVTAYK